MKKTFKGGKIIAEGLAFEKAVYDVSNNKISVRFDGKGAVNQYSVIGDKVYYSDDNESFRIMLDGKELSFNTPKSVEMIGRAQVITYHGEQADIVVKMFLDKYEECVFQRIGIKLKNPGRVEMGLFMWPIIADDFDKVRSIEYSGGFCIASNYEFISVEEENAIFFDIEANDDISVDLVYAFNNSDLAELCKKAEYYEQRAFGEIEEVRLPVSVSSEKEKAIYYSTYFCSLENYKEIGEFKGFMAGCNYVSPARTYYRDSYFTVLAMYNGHADMVRNEIVTLTKGIPSDGSCPSAVISDFSSFWGQHYDSPSMLCIMAYDYVNNTGDFGVLDEVIATGTVLDSLERVIKKLSLECDDSGLIVKKGKYNPRDWADCVHRVGYVSYVNILFARALYCMSRLTKNAPEKSKAYEEKYYRVKAAINSILWDESLGYYINFKNEEKQENNLSIDTVLAVIYGIADSERSKRILDNCERMLESRKHDDIEDFGVMCVYPFYSSIDTARSKSARPFDYHNGADWPYWSAMYAYALKLYGREYTYPLTRWFEYNIERGNYTPVEFYSSYCKTGSALQGWSSAPAFVYWDNDCTFFENKI